MYNITAAMTEFLAQRDRQWGVKVSVDGIEYDNRTVVGFVIEQSVASGEEFEIGAAVLGKMTLTLRTHETLPTGAKVIPYLDIDSTWLPMGEFYVDGRDKVADTWVFTCYDKLVFADVPYVSGLTYPATMQAVWNEITASLSYTSGASVVIDPAYTLPVAPTGYTKRQVLGFIAGANSASLFVDLAGEIKFRQYAAADAPVMALAMNDYIRVKQTNPVKTYSRIVCAYDEEDESTYEAGTGTDAQTLYITNPLMTQAMVDALQLRLNGFSYTPIEMDTRGYPHLEPGDPLSFDRLESPSWKDAADTWSGEEDEWTYVGTHQTLILHQTMTFKGGFKSSFQAPSVSDQKSELAVDGAISTAIQRVNKTAVKQGKAYYGVTVTPSQGLRVDKSDGAAAAILNADGIRFQANGVDKIYFDTASGKYKIVGDILMESGSIDWGNVTKPSYTSADVGALATDSPMLTHIDANGIYTGTLNANQINVGTLTGFTIQTAAAGRRLKLSGSSLGTYDGDQLDGFMLDGAGGDLKWYSAGVNRGGLFKNFSGVNEQLVLYHNNWLGVKADSRVDIQAPTIAFASGQSGVTPTVDFTGCTVLGVTAKFA